MDVSIKAIGAGFASAILVSLVVGSYLKGRNDGETSVRIEWEGAVEVAEQKAADLSETARLAAEAAVLASETDLQGLTASDAQISAELEAARRETRQAQRNFENVLLELQDDPADCASQPLPDSLRRPLAWQRASHISGRTARYTGAASDIAGLDDLAGSNTATD